MTPRDVQEVAFLYNKNTLLRVASSTFNKREDATLSSVYKFFIICLFIMHAKHN